MIKFPTILSINILWNPVLNSMNTSTVLKWVTMYWYALELSAQSTHAPQKPNLFSAHQNKAIPLSLGKNNQMLLASCSIFKFSETWACENRHEVPEKPCYCQRSNCQGGSIVKEVQLSERFTYQRGSIVREAQLPERFNCQSGSWVEKIRNPTTYLQSFLMRLCAFLVILLGNSIMSIPFRMMLYVFIGSEPENGGLKGMNRKK